MSAFTVEGGKPLKGNYQVCGNKNEALPLIAAALLCDSAVTLRNIPNIGDVRTMLAIAGALGAEVGPLRKGTVRIHAREPTSSELPLDLSARIRASILFASSLLVRTGRAVLPQPGGDSIGRRRADTHFLVFKALGAKFRTEKTVLENGITCTAFVLEAPRGLRGAEIYLDEASVTATENALIAAAGARGKTVIANAASEPHVQGLCRFLVDAGIKIEGVGSNILTVYGAEAASCVDHTVAGDYIEAGSIIGLAAATKSELGISGVPLEHMRMILFQFARLGIRTNVDPDNQLIQVPARQSLRMRHDLGGAIPRIEDSPWPGFPADLTSIMVVTATQARGTCLIHEKMFEARLFFVDKLIDMGGRIVLCDPHRVVVVGPSKLCGTSLTSPDIRAGMALLIAALAAEGKSLIQNIAQIDRGYERIDERLRKLGANISRLPDRRKLSRS